MKLVAIFTILLFSVLSFAKQNSFSGKVREVIVNNTAAKEMEFAKTSQFLIDDRRFIFCGVVNDDYPMRATQILTAAMLSGREVTVLTSEEAPNCIDSVKLAK